MRRSWDSGVDHVEDSSTFQPALAQGVDSRDGIDRSQAAALREIVWTLAGWVGFVVAVQLLLRALHIGWSAAAMDAARPIGRSIGEDQSRRTISPRRLLVLAAAFLLGLFGLVALKLWILARMLLAYLSWLFGEAYGPFTNGPSSHSRIFMAGSPSLWRAQTGCSHIAGTVMITVSNLHTLPEGDLFSSPRLKKSPRVAGAAKARARIAARRALSVIGLALVPVVIGLIGFGLVALKTWLFMPASFYFPSWIGRLARTRATAFMSSL
jgi:hypothetical protein